MRHLDERKHKNSDLFKAVPLNKLMDAGFIMVEQARQHLKTLKAKAKVPRLVRGAGIRCVK